MARPLDIPGTISTLQLQPLVDALGKLGLDASRVLGRAGLTFAEVADSRGRVAAGLEFEVWDAIEELSGDPCIGLRLADQIGAGALGAYEYLLRNSATLRGAIEHANRYERVVDDLTRVSLIEDGAQAMLRLWRVGDFPHPAQGVECLFAVLKRLIAVELPQAGAEEVRFAHRLSGDLRARTERFGCSVRFDQPYNELVFAAALLDLPLAHADVRLGQVLEEQVQHMLAALPAEDPLIQRARTALAASLAGGEASLEMLADALHMSARTLRRRLDDHGTSYKDLLDGVRKELASHYVTRTDESLEQIARRLGFTEPSAFYRGFKRWFGTTPAAYRTRGAS